MLFITPLGNHCVNEWEPPTGLQKSQQEVAAEAVKLVRETIGPVAAFRKVLFVKGLPKTRSGKIPRSSLADLANGKPYKVGLRRRNTTRYNNVLWIFDE